MDLLAPPGAGEGDAQDAWRLMQEVRELKDYSERVTRELRRYQQARPPPPARPEDSLPLPPWATNMQMMSPLLFAYEERITELEAVIERSVSLAEQAQVLAKENDALRAELQERTEQLRNAQLVAPAPQLLEKEGGEELEELYRLSVEQNEALSQQNQLLKLQVERMQQSLAASQQQVREAQNRAWEVAQGGSKEHERAEALARQRSAAESRLEVVTGELVEEVRMREQLQAQAEGLQHKVSIQQEGLDSFKRLGAAAHDEEERLRADLTRTNAVEKEQRSRIASLERELMETTEQLVATRKESDDHKREAERMLPVMESMRQRLDDISERHNLLQAKLAEEEKQVDSLTFEKTALSTSEQALKRQNGRVEYRLKEEVEALRQQHASSEEVARSTHSRRVSELEERLRRSEQQAAEFQTRVELAEKQRSWEASSMSRQSSLHAAEKKAWQDDLDQAQQDRSHMQRQVDGMETECTRLKLQNDEAREELAALHRNLAQAREEAERAVVSEVDNARLRAELHAERVRVGDEREADQRRAEDEKRVLERQLYASQARARKEEQTAVDLLRAQESLRMRWQAELGLEREALEAQVQRLTQENRAIREKSRGLLKAFAQRRGSGEEPGSLLRIRPDITA